MGSGIALKNNVIVTRNGNLIEAYSINSDGIATLSSSFTIPNDLGYSTYIAYGDYILVSLSNYSNFGPSLAVIKLDGQGQLKLVDVIGLERQPNAISTEGSTAILGYPGTKQLQILNFSE